MPRLFVAVYPIPFTEKYLEIQKQIKPLVQGKFVEKQNFHITLSFIGNVENNRVDQIVEKIKLVSSNFDTITANIDGVFLIPNKKYIRVIALGVKSTNLLNLGKALEKTLNSDSKPPHITLVRVKNVFDKQKLVEKCESINLNLTFQVTSIKLMESVLKPTGPVYRVVKNFELNKASQ